MYWFVKVIVVLIFIQQYEVQCDYVGNITEEELQKNFQFNSKCRCGQKLSNRIVGGKPAEANEYPWMAGLFLPNVEPAIRGFYCGGSLINDRYVLTAAHCVEDLRPRDMVVRLGEHDRSKPGQTQIQIISASSFIIHPRYNSKTIANDIALIKLSSPARLSETISPICLPPSNSPSFAQQSTYVAGWGRIKFQGSLANVLKELQMRVMPNPACQRRWKRAGVKIFPSNICAFKNSSSDMGTCNGDSGGALIFNNQKQRQWDQIGIVSYGVSNTCGTRTFPDVFTRVSNYKEFIRKNTADGVFCTGTCLS